MHVVVRYDHVEPRHIASLFILLLCFYLWTCERVDPYCVLICAECTMVLFTVEYSVSNSIPTPYLGPAYVSFRSRWRWRYPEYMSHFPSIIRVSSGSRFGLLNPSDIRRMGEHIQYKMTLIARRTFPSAVSVIYHIWHIWLSIADYYHGRIQIIQEKSSRRTFDQQAGKLSFMLVSRQSLKRPPRSSP